MWTNTNTLGNIRKERTRGRHRMSRLRPWQPLTAHEEAWTTFGCCITVRFTLCHTTGVWSQTWHERLTKIRSQLRDGTFSLLWNFLSKLNFEDKRFLLISWKAPIGVLCLGCHCQEPVFLCSTAQKLNRRPWGSALKRQFSKTHGVINQVAFSQAYHCEEAAWVFYSFFCWGRWGVFMSGKTNFVG